ncbi:class I SAM-dependent methyltransferase [Paenibacillus melissococcoides]|uniref:Class I SAM-dependent methyltransferase n=1 Tax=Paenibacillus melissococcoides TaxID=2912268 RepID=A0ABN8U4H9_9BACL|nr:MULTISPECIES: class I SAM-dependent methyltransferase [Paenibacillus]MEB9892196.1 class I SAM-dependent methyltransferase [Bacillus cereus]CAH8245816.1 class I SAM-dependent methyltransferase [Paenibacillus melissococcoides]CAH8712168.1 class I SAM-dependent methyltransferase [Paenibacillus melissococcoides]CAH8712912.1 class I SAM-dependent methyltransferase [Paenibacillus melissococcoides]
MVKDKPFEWWIEQANQPFSGWDFSYISGTGRMSSGCLAWSYASMAIPLMQSAQSMLDMGTGGGELLSMLRPWPKSVCATEGYPPNLPVAKERLEPLGVTVLPVEDDEHLPFATGQFDLVLNQHESYSPREVRRVLSDGGRFFTQQAGGSDCFEINERFGVPLNEEFAEWKLDIAVRELQEHRFEVVKQAEQFLSQRFYDVGALVYYLKAIPWQIPDFEVEKYREELYDIHQLIERQGYFEVTQHRFYLLAKALS